MSSEAIVHQLKAHIEAMEQKAPELVTEVLNLVEEALRSGMPVDEFRTRIAQLALARVPTA